MSYIKQGFTSGQTLKADHLNYIEEGITKAAVQPDWNQNDETAADYVKNRTHWKEFSAIVEEQTIEGFSVMEDPIYAVQNPFVFTPAVGDKYIVHWDGDEYNVDAKELDGMICIGNENYINMISGGDIPFAIIFVGDNVSVATESTVASHTICIGVEVVHKLDERFVQKDVVVAIASDNWSYGMTMLDASGASVEEIKEAYENNVPILLTTHTDSHNSALAFNVGFEDADGMRYLRFIGFNHDNYNTANNLWEDLTIVMYLLCIEDNEYCGMIRRANAMLFGSLNRNLLDAESKELIYGEKTFKPNKLVVQSSTDGSNKKFAITITDNGAITATEVI